MSRDSAGNYTLPGGNPVVSGTIISSTWANTTMSDIATTLTASLDRSGNGGMLASLKLAAGAIGAPGLSWSAETTSGLYRAGAADFRYSIASTDRLQLTASLFKAITSEFELEGADPLIHMDETDAAANERNWLIRSVGGLWALSTATDAAPTTGVNNAILVDRTGTTVDSIALSATAASFNGTFTFSVAASSPSTYGVLLNSATPFLAFSQSSGAANNKLWDIGVSSETLAFRVVSDAGVGVNWATIDRTANVVDSIVLAATLVQFTAATANLTSAGTTTLRITDSSAPANEKIWGLTSAAGVFGLQTFTDAGAATINAILVDRTGTAVDVIEMNTALLRVNGVHNGTAMTGTNGFVGSGTYTPTLTNVTNVSGSTGGTQSEFMRVGRVVTVCGSVTGSTSGAGTCSVGISLPIASSIANSSQIAGAGGAINGVTGTTAATSGSIAGDVANTRANLQFLATGAGTFGFNYTFTYVVV